MKLFMSHFLTNKATFTLHKFLLQSQIDTCAKKYLYQRETYIEDQFAMQFFVHTYIAINIEYNFRKEETIIIEMKPRTMN